MISKLFSAELVYTPLAAPSSLCLVATDDCITLYSHSIHVFSRHRLWFILQPLDLVMKTIDWKWTMKGDEI